MRILITGANGQLGHELQDMLREHSLTLFARPAFELRAAGAERQVLDARPDLVIHAGAYTDVDGSEKEPEVAMAVNAQGTERVARAAHACGARLIYLSTDYVFDGRKATPYDEADLPNPVSVYGRSKLEGERLALQHCPQALVIRTAWLYGSNGKNFIKTIVRLATERPELRVVADQRGCPTYARDLARAIATLLTRDVAGVLHLTGTGDCTWHDLACAIVSHMRLAVPVLPITTTELNRPAPRPAYSVLAHDKAEGLGIRVPHWKDALVRFLDEVGAAERQDHP